MDMNVYESIITRRLWLSFISIGSREDYVDPSRNPDLLKTISLSRSANSGNSEYSVNGVPKDDPAT